MSNPRVTLTESDLERLESIGHLHCYTDKSGVTVTLEMAEEGGSDE